MIQSHALSASLFDSSASRLGEVESSDLHLGEAEAAGVVQHRADHDGDLVVLLVLHEAFQTRHRQIGTVGPAHAQTVQNNLHKEQ